MSTFIIFGATGAVGRFLLPQLLAGGHAVLAISRRPQAPAERLSWCVGDLFAVMPPLPAGADCVISLGPLDAFACWFESAPLAGTRRLIALSSMSAESKFDSADASERALAAQLVAAEQRVANNADARGVAWTLLRPTLIYGDGSDASLAPIARFARRTRILPVPIGACGLRQPVHAADVANAVVAAIDRPAAFGKTYPLGGGERLRFDRMVLRLRSALPGLIVPLPVPAFVVRALRRLGIGGALAQVGDAALQRLRVPLIADNASAERDFGYAPRAFDPRALGDFLSDRSRR